jgi:hypothetical protein
MLDPRAVLEEATKNSATFTRRQIQALLRRHDIVGQEAAAIVAKVFADPDTIALYGPEDGKATNRYTTRMVREQEARILDMAAQLTKAKTSKAKLERMSPIAAAYAEKMGLAPEQRAALFHAIGGGRLKCIRGVAGAGKSYTIRAIRQAYEDTGFRVIGLAPTNKVVSAMAADGFERAATLHSEKYRLEKARQGDLVWNRNTLVVIDEAGMIDTEMIEWVLLAVQESGARLVLVGDDTQLSSVQRGGMFGQFRAKFGAAELREIRRQNQDWAKAASLDLADGYVREALDAYAERGKIHFSAKLEEAKSALYAKWSEDSKSVPIEGQYVFAATNAAVDDLNDGLQAIRFKGRTDFLEYDCKRGRLRVFPGDRIQFHVTEKSLNILNGHIGTVFARSEREICVTLDSGEEIRFDPAAYDGWGLGYAGTVYKGQGATLPRAYALYDHVLSWSARSTYVALTRHREDFDLFVPRDLAQNMDRLALQMSRNDGADASHVYLTENEAAARFPKIPLVVRDVAGKQQQVDAGDSRDAEAIERYLKAASKSKFVDVFRRFVRAAQSADRYHPIHDRVSSAKAIARVRGFLPANGYPDPRCLEDLEGSRTLRADPALRPRQGEVDIRPLLQDGLSVSVEALRQARKRLRDLEAQTLKAIVRSLDAARQRAGWNDNLRYPIVIMRAFIQSWTYGWRKRLGTDIISGQAPGHYRQSLPLMGKARRAFRLAERKTPAPAIPAPEPQVSLRPARHEEVKKTPPAPALKPHEIARAEHERLLAALKRIEERIGRLDEARKTASDREQQRIAIDLAAANMRKEQIERDLLSARATTRPPAQIILPAAALQEDELIERANTSSGIGRPGSDREPEITPRGAPTRTPNSSSDKGVSR